MVDVTQEDRDAAAAVFYAHQRGSLSWMYAFSGQDRIIAGKWDEHSTVQAFATHARAAGVVWLFNGMMGGVAVAIIGLPFIFGYDY